MNCWARPTARPIRIPVTQPGRTRKRTEAANPRNQHARNAASVSAMREKAMCGPAQQIDHAATIPATGPNSLHAMTPTRLIVAAPRVAETNNAAASIGPIK